MARKVHLRGRVVLLWIQSHVFLTVLALIVVWGLRGEVAKVYWDWRIEQRCASEQVILIFAQTRLPPDPNRIIFGRHSIPLKSNFTSGDKFEYKPGDLYYRTWAEDVIWDGHPRVVKYTTRIFLSKTNDLLGSSVSYSRIGGDIFYLDHHTSHHCGATAESLENILFARMGDS